MYGYHYKSQLEQISQFGGFTVFNVNTNGSVTASLSTEISNFLVCNQAAQCSGPKTCS